MQGIMYDALHAALLEVSSQIAEQGNAKQRYCSMDKVIKAQPAMLQVRCLCLDHPQAYCLGLQVWLVCVVYDLAHAVCEQ